MKFIEELMKTGKVMLYVNEYNRKDNNKEDYNLYYNGVSLDYELPLGLYEELRDYCKTNELHENGNRFIEFNNEK